MKSNWRLASAAVISGMMLTVTACGGTSSGGGASQADDTFTYGVSGPVLSWDPRPETRAFAMGWFTLVYEGLLTTDASGALQPGLATEWKVSADAVDLTLREGITFQDGTAFDAEAVKANIEAGKKVAGVTGAALAPIASVEIVDAAHVSLKLASPAPDLLDQLARIPGLMISPGVSADDVAKGVPAGTGPYQVDAANSNPKSAWKFVQNESYWNKDADRFADVEFRIISDPTARLNALMSGQIDAADIAATQVAQAESSGLKVNTSPTNIATFEILDSDGTKVSAFADPQVRRALAMAIDRETFAKTVFGGLAEPVDQLLPEGVPGHIDDAEPYAYNPDEAKRLLKEAGAENLTFSVPSDPVFFAKGATALQGMLAKVGVEMKVETVASGAEMTAKIAAAEFPATYTYIPDRSAQTIYNKHILPGAVYNPFKVAKPEIAAAEEAALAGFPDVDKMTIAFEDLFRAVNQEALIIPIVELRSAIAYDPDQVGDVPAWTGVPITPYVVGLEPKK
ncbi:ABC transporter substrate-binding protein [Nocardioides daejeonensis]|uniref:ABC transporter substrate-binding protein n=1 Tax=Nocardioides daejeonensis TaxID=1046556 RepID=UPI000D747187|nr:ABC transporter substrate-binding protein [Nocardioides daejeonensis]